MFSAVAASLVLATTVLVPPESSARSPLECDDTPRILGTDKRDRLHGTGCYDIIEGRQAADRINGRGGFDILFGNRGPDLIIASDGERDVLRGGPGNDRCIVDEMDEVRGCEAVVVPAGE